MSKRLLRDDYFEIEKGLLNDGFEKTSNPPFPSDNPYRAYIRADGLGAQINFDRFEGFHVTYFVPHTPIGIAE